MTEEEKEDIRLRMLELTEDVLETVRKLRAKCTPLLTLVEPPERPSE